MPCRALAQATVSDVGDGSRRPDHEVALEDCIAGRTGPRGCRASSAFAPSPCVRASGRAQPHQPLRSFRARQPTWNPKTSPARSLTEALMAYRRRLTSTPPLARRTRRARSRAFPDGAARDPRLLDNHHSAILCGSQEQDPDLGGTDDKEAPDQRGRSPDEDARASKEEAATSGQRKRQRTPATRRPPHESSELVAYLRETVGIFARSGRAA